MTPTICRCTHHTSHGCLKVPEGWQKSKCVERFLNGLISLLKLTLSLSLSVNLCQSLCQSLPSVEQKGRSKLIRLKLHYKYSVIFYQFRTNHLSCALLEFGLKNHTLPLKVWMLISNSTLLSVVYLLI